MESGAVAEWLVADGNHVTQGQPLYTLEAEKAVEEIEAPATGILTIHKHAHEECPVGTLLAEIR